MGIPSDNGNTRVFEVTPPPSDSESEEEPDGGGAVLHDETSCKDSSTECSDDDQEGSEASNYRTGIHWDRLCAILQKDDETSCKDSSTECSDDDQEEESDESEANNPEQAGIHWDRLCTTWLILNNMQVLDTNSLNTALLEVDELEKMRAHCEALLRQMGAVLDPETSMLVWPNLDVERFVLAHDVMHALIQWNSGPFCDFYTQPGCSQEALTDLSTFLATCGLRIYAHHNISCMTQRFSVRIGGPAFQDRRPQYRLVSPRETAQE